MSGTLIARGWPDWRGSQLLWIRKPGAFYSWRGKLLQVEHFVEVGPARRVEGLKPILGDVKVQTSAGKTFLVLFFLFSEWLTYTSGKKDTRRFGKVVSQFSKLEEYQGKMFNFLVRWDDSENWTVSELSSETEKYSVSELNPRKSRWFVGCTIQVVWNQQRWLVGCKGDVAVDASPPVRISNPENQKKYHFEQSWVCLCGLYLKQNKQNSLEWNCKAKF